MKFSPLTSFDFSSFRRKPESRKTGCESLVWIPACAGMTEFVQTCQRTAQAEQPDEFRVAFFRHEQYNNDVMLGLRFILLIVIVFITLKFVGSVTKNSSWMFRILTAMAVITVMLVPCPSLKLG